MKSDKTSNISPLSDFGLLIDKYKRLFPDISNKQHENYVNELEYLIKKYPFADLK